MLRDRMLVPDIAKQKRQVIRILSKQPSGKRGSLAPIARAFIARKDELIGLAAKHPTPFYILDERTLRTNARRFRAAFKKLPTIRHYYAVKANHHPHVLRTIVEEGFGLEVSSGRELKFALDAKAERIVFSGPGKTIEDLEIAVMHAEKVIVHIDSFTELRRLGELTTRRKIRIRAGVRIYTSLHGSWSKFGIPLREWQKFWEEAQKYPNLSLEGVQSHMSWNMHPRRYEALLKEFATALKKTPTRMLRSIRFIDIGGGFYPHRAEGYYPWTAHYPGTPPAGKIMRIANDYFGDATPFVDKYFITESAPIEKFANVIIRTIDKFISPLLDCEYFTEPGRIICTEAMHIVLRALDRKDARHVIMDGGVNMVGWEYGEFFYAPIINLSRPSLKERDVTLFGPLCTPHDIWGYHCFCKDVCEGDVILVSNQGAYRYGLAQSFIKPLPDVHVIS